MLSSEKEWQRIAAEFEERWDFPICTPAIDGKHVLLKQPANSGYCFTYIQGHLQHSLIGISWWGGYTNLPMLMLDAMWNFPKNPLLEVL